MGHQKAWCVPYIWLRLIVPVVDSVWGTGGDQDVDDACDHGDRAAKGFPVVHRSITVTKPNSHMKTAWNRC